MNPYSVDGLGTKCVMSIELKNVWDRDIDLLSGGELQRFAIAMVCVQKADV
jgi:ATP-binding cassette subfamily E protein 1